MSNHAPYYARLAEFFQDVVGDFLGFVPLKAVAHDFLVDEFANLCPPSLFILLFFCDDTSIVFLLLQTSADERARIERLPSFSQEASRGQKNNGFDAFSRNLAN